AQIPYKDSLHRRCCIPKRAAAARILAENFHRANQTPSPEPLSPEPVTWPAALPTKPYTHRALQPPSPTAEPYGRALAKPKRWQGIQPKPTPSTHPPHHPQAPS